jgi:hypothetical protein
MKSPANLRCQKKFAEDMRFCGGSDAAKTHSSVTGKPESRNSAFKKAFVEKRSPALEGACRVQMKGNVCGRV